MKVFKVLVAEEESTETEDDRGEEDRNKQIQPNARFL